MPVYFCYSFQPMETLELSTRSRDIKTAASLLQNRGLVVFPTETVYGLGADAESAEAVEKVFTAKNRPRDNPLIVHVSDIEMARRYAEALSEVEAGLLAAFSPGPFTLIVNRNPDRGGAAAAGHATLGLRIPDSPAALHLIRCLGRGIAAPSANRSGRPSPTNFSMAWGEMSGRVDAVIHGPPCDRGLESTIIRCTSERVEILRPGSVTLTMLEAALLNMGSDLPVVASGGRTAPATPGTRYRHYAPSARIVLFGEYEELAAALDALKNNEGSTVFSGAASGGAMILLPGAGFSDADVSRMRELCTIENPGSRWAAGPCRDVRVFGNADEYARGLYKSFVDADISGCSTVLAYLPARGPDTEALRDRLMRAARG